MNTYKLGSLFDGSGGFPLAGALCGIEPRWAAEVEPYPIAVTRSRLPNMKHLGDISKVNGAEIEPVDIITFGSPCQDLSVAGKRAGLKHADNGDEETTRSGLFMEAVRIIKEMRTATNGNYPRFALWENVPGAFSSNNGEDFRIVCEELIKIVEPSASMPPVPKGGWNYADSYIGDGWSLAYRVFDAQYWGVPQRRRRIYLVADFRGERAREVLFEREGLRGYFAEGRTPWQAAPADAQGGSGADDREGEGDGGDGRRLDGVSYGVVTKGNGDAFLSEEKHTTLTVGGGQAGQGYPAAMVPYTLKIRSGCEGGGKGALVQEDKSATLATNNDQYLFQPTAYSFDSLASNSMKSPNPHSGCREVQVSKTLDTTDPNPSKNQGGIAVVQPIAINQHAQSDRWTVEKENTVQTLPAAMGMGGGHGPLIIQPKDPVYCLQGNGIDRADTAGCNGKGVKEDICYTLNTIDRPAVAYGLDRASFNQGQNAKFDFSVTGEQQPTITARGPGAVVHARKASFFTRGSEGAADTLVATDYKDPQIVAYAESGTNGSRVSNTLVASMGNAPTGTTQDNLFVRTNYIVRRLTPTECARLQGFADQWGHIEQKDTLTDEELRFWLEVRNTHARINGKKEQDYTGKQMLTWYNKLWTDSAEYKMWGNGIALPTALYCVQGAADVLSTAQEEDTDDWMN